MNNPIVPPVTNFTPKSSENHRLSEYFGSHHTYKFPNGYGASVIRIHDAWELAVLNASGNLDYSTPVTSDVIGWQTDEEIDALLKQISELPAGGSND